MRLFQKVRPNLPASLLFANSESDRLGFARGFDLLEIAKEAAKESGKEWSDSNEQDS
ncbi:MAG: hypothetical protein R3E66_20015 [bacterium]